MLHVKIFLSNTFLYIENFILILIQNVYWFRKPENISNILIYKIGNIGDLVTAYPAIKIVRYKFPKAKITLLTSTGDKKRIKTKNWRKGVSGVSIFENQNTIDDILYYEKVDMESITKLINEIRAKKFDRAFIMSASNTSFLREFRNLIFFAFLKIKYVSGFSITFPSIFKKSFSLQKPFLLRNEVDRYIYNLNLGISFESKFFNYEFSNINNDIKYRLQSINKPLVVALGSKFKNRKWDIDKFQNIIEKWHSQIGDIIFIGNKDDHIESERIINQLKKNKSGNYPMNFCGQTSIEESIYIIQSSSAMIANCSGPAHLASLTKTKVVTIQSSYSFPNVWGSYFSKKYVLRPHKGICDEDIEFCNCINKVTVNEAWKNLMDLHKSI
jgi:ADP-heptose:LPS heptosyltransferase